MENRLVEKRAQVNSACASLAYTGASQAALRYDPLGRLHETIGSTGAPGTTRMLYDGDALTAEYDTAGTLLRRYVHGADSAADDPVVWYEGASFGAANERQMRPDWQGSIVIAANSTGSTVLGVNRYDEYGIPDANNLGRFQYTGQAWIPELGMYHYKARIYSPTLGRFLQTDPIGYEDQVNLYAYVGGDPVNGVDPSGLCDTGSRIPGAAVGCKVLEGFQDTVKKVVDVGKKAVNAVKDGKRKVDAAVDVATDAVDAVTYDAGELEEDIDMAVWGKKVPDEAHETLDQYEKQNYKWESYQSYGAHTYRNQDGRLPKGEYRAMYVRQFDRGKMFGPAPSDRLIVDLKTGAAYYTPKHYNIFVKIR